MGGSRGLFSDLSCALALYFQYTFVNLHCVVYALHVEAGGRSRRESVCCAEAQADAQADSLPSLSTLERGRMSQQWQPRQQREQSYEQPIEYDGKGLSLKLSRLKLTLPLPSSAYGNPINPTESKREKRRRDMVERVGRLHADTLERRDR